VGCLWGWFGCLLGNSLGFRVFLCGFVWFFFLWVGFGCSCVYSRCTYRRLTLFIKFSYLSKKRGSDSEGHLLGDAWHRYPDTNFPKKAVMEKSNMLEEEEQPRLDSDIGNTEEQYSQSFHIVGI